MRNIFLLVLSAMIGASTSLLIENGLFVTPATTPEQKLEAQRPISQPSGSEQGKKEVARGATDAQLEEFAELRFRVEALALSVKALQRHQKEMALTQNTESRIRAVAEEPEQLETNPTSAEEEEDRWRDLKIAMHQEVNTGELDADWSSFASDEISRRLEGEENDQFSLREVRCSTTTCRIQIQIADDPNGAPGIEPIMPDFLPWEAEAYMETDEHDPTQLVVYLAREGETLGAGSGSMNPGS